MSEKQSLKITKIIFLVIFNLITIFIFIVPSPEDSPVGNKLGKFYKYMFKERVFMSCVYKNVRTKTFQFNPYGSVKNKYIYRPKEYCRRVKEGFIEIYNQKLYPTKDPYFDNYRLLSKFNEEFKNKRRIYQDIIYPSFKKRDRFAYSLSSIIFLTLLAFSWWKRETAAKIIIKIISKAYGKI